MTNELDWFRHLLFNPWLRLKAPNVRNRQWLKDVCRRPVLGAAMSKLMCNKDKTNREWK